ncbi:MAG TPA: TIGR03013 family XrtA/PEP-CTERM system glycosyltransferase [Burkholderiaceae bacterium]|nr:TIGR03013 family XrtA/PEP-CTERM system glycosyltransferase [Burkholderiaceae bacterium]
MIKLFRHYVPTSTVVELLADGLLCFFAILFAVLVGASPSARDYGDIPMRAVLLPAAVFSLVMTAVCAALGLYKRHEIARFSLLVRRAILALALASPIAYFAFTLIPDGNKQTREAIGFTLLFLLGGLVVIRQVLLRLGDLGIGERRVLIVGACTEARHVEADLTAPSYPKVSVVGFRHAGTQDPDAQLRPRLLPTQQSLLDAVRLHKVDEIIVAVREQRGGVMPLDELLECRINGIPVVDLAGFYERVRGEVPVESLKASWLIYGNGFVQHAMRSFVKRIFDIAVSIVLLMLAAPVMLVTAFAIRRESPGPIIYRQERVGLGGRTFNVLKFRSMRNDAEQNGVAQWATRNDARITRVGNFIRKTRIDELPQLINVLRGEMSLVGPRPERPSFVKQLKERVPFYDVRHSVKPGVTGWAQVRYSYGASIEESRKKLQFDLYYVKNHSLFLDVLILVETVRVILFREGAR